MVSKGESEALATRSDGKSDNTRVKACTAATGLVRRLGVLELGWYAHEEAMPFKVLNRIEAGEAIIVPGIISVLAQGCEQDHSVKTAYLCHPSVQYITKFKGEGSFCGYRNIQMLISYIVGSKYQAGEVFPNGIPSILQLQDLIEDAWDRGINTEGRLETGGIRGTRKHIGTPEAQALFKGLDITCSVRSFRSSDGDPKAWNHLLRFVEEYFAKGSDASSETKVHGTDLPPIYLQRPRHSLTIIGFETREDGSSNLLVLDPGLRPSLQVMHAAKAVEDGRSLDNSVSMRPYRRGKWRLGLFKEFETLVLASPT